jgi:hypothetical protein
MLGYPAVKYIDKISFFSSKTLFILFIVII